MATITGREEMFKNVNLTKIELDLINLSSTFVEQLLKYNADVVSKNVKVMQVDPSRSGIGWDANDNVISFGKYGNTTYVQLDAQTFVGVLAHEIGHYINDGRDKAVDAKSASAMRDDFDLAAIIGVTKEAEAAYNNWLIAFEIIKGGG